ncbi:MAG: undecaprenyl-phosphate glucose phosphotransferase, partial [Gemmataceae bacterium]|nr:undecaprenyl-phosphate glucose phosphotransferase [Gemmataceae bacterium]
MIDRRSQAQSLLFLLSDLALAVAAWLAAYWIRFGSGWLAPNGDLPPFYWCWRQTPLVLLAAFAAFRIAGMYQIGRLRRFREEVVAVACGAGLMALFTLALLFFLQDPYESRGILLLFAGLAAAFILLVRRAGWKTLHALRRAGFNQTSALVVGTGRVARRMARSLRSHKYLGIRVAGYVEDAVGPMASDLAVLGRIDELPALIGKHKVSHVFIALPFKRYDDVRRVFALLSQTTVEVRLVPDLPAMAGLAVSATDLDGMTVLGLRENPLVGLNVVVKRAMDIVFSLVGIILLSPLMAFIALLVKWTSPGPVFYSQERCGLGGKRFWMLKFRSMKVAAEAATGAVWAKKDDDRKTWFGGFLRKTSLDELPQLFNVLWGDMSLVGPRPERPEFIAQFTKTVPFYNSRHAVKAGITGWAQVNGWRGNTSLRKRVQHDLHYITH